MTQESFMSRWSRRKLGVVNPQPTPSCPATVTEELDPLIKATRRLLGDEMPLDARKLALRDLWRSDPILSASDPFDVYNGDCGKSFVACIAKEAEELLEVMAEEEPSPPEDKQK